MTNIAPEIAANNFLRGTWALMKFFYNFFNSGYFCHVVLEDEKKKKFAAGVVSFKNKTANNSITVYRYNFDMILSVI